MAKKEKKKSKKNKDKKSKRINLKSRKADRYFYDEMHEALDRLNDPELKNKERHASILSRIKSLLAKLANFILAPFKKLAEWLGMGRKQTIAVYPTASYAYGYTGG
jgi:hypothetical protein